MTRTPETTIRVELELLCLLMLMIASAASMPVFHPVHPPPGTHPPRLNSNRCRCGADLTPADWEEWDRYKRGARAGLVRAERINATIRSGSRINPRERRGANQSRRTRSDRRRDRLTPPRCPDCNRLMQPNNLGPWRPPWYVCPWRSEGGDGAHMPRYEQQQWPRKRRGAKR